MVLVLLTIACGSEVKVGGTKERFNIRKKQERGGNFHREFKMQTRWSETDIFHMHFQ